MVSRFMARRAAAREMAQARQLSTGIARLEDQAQRLSASTVQPESPADGGASGGFAGIGILAVVLLIAGVIVGKLRSKAPGKKVAGQAFTSKDRALIELLSEIVDVVNSVEK